LLIFVVDTAEFKGIIVDQDGRRDAGSQPGPDEPYDPSGDRWSIGFFNTGKSIVL
jgi:hypothetical protein